MVGSGPVHPLSQEKTNRLENELQVHRLELERQNEELRLARAEVEAGLQKYYELYDFAPIGYCTVDGNGLVRESNLAGALLLGLDRAPEGSDASRTDTMILMAVNPLQPRVTMLSIPRDLWVSIPNVGENRINTAHFFAEAADPGSGPRAALDTVRQNFGVPTRYYVRVRFDGFVEIINAMGGVTITLEQPTGLLEAGTHQLDGTQALAFVRDRSGADDFFRMAHAQILLKAAVQKWLNPLTWVRLPAVAAALSRSLDTNLPFWQWPRMAVALARSLLGGLDARTLPREAVTPFITNEGAAVLLPNWDLIRPLVDELF